MSSRTARTDWNRPFDESSEASLRRPHLTRMGSSQSRLTATTSDGRFPVPTVTPDTSLDGCVR